jgi:CDP-diacylglycerol---serine O-phosphatidyltransferase
MKQIPNLFTLLNLFLGCIAIVCVLQSGITLVDDVKGGFASVIPEKICLASIFIAAAGIVDFLDGFVARLMKASSEMGKQLDSLADVVSFGVAPGMIIFQFLRLSFAQQPDGLDVSAVWLLPAFILPCAGAYRLARFNIDTEQSYGFKGLPIPAAGLLIASFPLIYWFSDQAWIIHLLVNKWFLYGVILVVSYLMVSTLPMMALKFKNASLKDNWPKLVLVIAAIICALLFHWVAVPLVFIVYIALSLALK